jgi:hypothetical protein
VNDSIYMAITVGFWGKNSREMEKVGAGKTGRKKGGVRGKTVTREAAASRSIIVKSATNIFSPISSQWGDTPKNTETTSQPNCTKQKTAHQISDPRNAHGTAALESISLEAMLIWSTWSRRAT